MSIQVSCPQCQKAYTFPEDKRGKQVRCQDCFQVFHAGDPPADASAETVEAAAPPEFTPPAPAPKPAPKPAVKSAVKPRAAEPRPAAKPAPKPAAEPGRVSSRSASNSGALRRPARQDDDVPPRAEPPRRRRRSGMGVMGILAVFLVLLLVGGGGGAAAILAFKDKLPFLPSASADSHPTNATPPADQNATTTPEKTDPIAGKLAGVLSQENFDKIDKNMTKDDLTKLLGPPTMTQDDSLVWRVGGVGPRIAVNLKDGRVSAKSSGQDWKVAYASDVAVKPPPDMNPPPDKPAPGVSRDTFDKIAKGMTEKDLADLLGANHGNVPVPGGAVLAWASKDLTTTVTVTMADGKVVEKKSSENWPVMWPTDVAQNPPPDKPAPGVTKENFDRIDKGTTLQEVQDLLGPDWKRKPSGQGTALFVWDRDVEVYVRGDQPDAEVFDKSNARGWPIVFPTEALAQPDKSVPPTREKYDKIDKAMSQKDLLALLGPPTTAGRASGVNVDTMMEWGPVRVMLKKGKVIDKSNFAMWPTVYPGDVAQNPPPDKPARSPLQVNFDKIDKGMAAQQLFDMFGKPPDADKALAAGANINFEWIAQDGKTKISAMVAQGKVVSKDNNSGWPIVYPSDVVKNPPPDKPAAGVTQENFDKIDKGMTEDALTALLGPAAEHHNLPPVIGGPTSRLVWRVNGKPVVGIVVINGKVVIDKAADPTVVVDLMQGTVVSKVNNVGWPVVYPSDVVKNPPADKLADFLTQANFDKITKGMTPDDLTKLFGPPTASQDFKFNGADTMLHWTVRGGPTIHVMLAQGKVINKENTQNWPINWPDAVAQNPPPPPPPPPPPDKPDPTKFAAAVNKDNFDKIAKGMSKDALMDLFGPPIDVKPQPAPGVDERLTWQGNGAKILVSVSGGKVVTKLTTADWPVVYPK